MSWLKRMFDGLDSRHRKARAAEGAGDWRRAASIWAEADEPERAAEALLHLAEREPDLEDRLEAWYDALRWIPEDDEERREEVERKMALAVLDDARHRGATSAEEKRRLTEAAGRLERLDYPKEAAEAFGLLGRRDDQARCLQAAGEVERLEALLSHEGEREQQQSKLRRLLSDYEMALQYGARLEARTALREASRIAPDERSVAELLRRLEGRMPPPSRVKLDIAGQPVTFVGRLPAVIGRGEVDVRVRGTSVSRRHAEIAHEGGRLIIRDLDSRNGTLVRGLPIAGELELSGATEIGLGDDVRVDLAPLDGAVAIHVRSGFDRGAIFVLGAEALRHEGLGGSIEFPEGWAVLTADRGVELTLEGKTCALPVHLLFEDRLVLGGVPLEVLE